MTKDHDRCVSDSLIGWRNKWQSPHLTLHKIIKKWDLTMSKNEQKNEKEPYTSKKTNSVWRSLEPCNETTQIGDCFRGEWK